MKKVKLTLIMMIVLTAMSFIASEKLSFKTGSYGVCNCDDNSVRANKIELIINDDFTFHYINNSNQNKKVETKGKWTRKRNTIFLQDYDSEFAIHNKWNIDNNEKCLKSRKGLNFMRLCHIKSCMENK